MIWDSVYRTMLGHSPVHPALAAVPSRSTADRGPDGRQVQHGEAPAVRHPDRAPSDSETPVDPE